MTRCAWLRLEVGVGLGEAVEVAELQQVLSVVIYFANSEVSYSSFCKGGVYFAVHLIVLRTVIEGVVLLYFSNEINENP